MGRMWSETGMSIIDNNKYMHGFIVDSNTQDDFFHG